MRPNITPNNHEKQLAAEDFIVSKTDTTGRITYANRIFMDIAGYRENALLGIQHNIIRHPDMPRGVYRFMWDTLKQGEEFFGFVKNLSADGSFYWVLANVTPDYNRHGELMGYYSVRRKPPQSAINTVTRIYQQMLSIEQQSPSKKEAPNRSMQYLEDTIKQLGVKSYTHLILDLYGA
ncbi:MAG: PAS domain-containing protein [Methylococcales bacterium]|nr:PAS domain-containing protein [Methylococcales bacterium]